MLSLAWRFLVVGLLVPFLLVPGINIVALPLWLYLVCSLAAIAWRRHAAPRAPD